MQKFMRLSLAAILVATVTGCASVPMAPADADKAAKQFATSPDKGNVYIYRNESMGAAIKMGIYVNEKPIGQTAAKTYLLIPLAPGVHKIRGHAENDSFVDLDVKAGKNYFIWQEVKMGGMSARNLLQVVDEATGKKAVSQCKLTAAGQ
jgi:hypothetical protein